MDYPDVLVVQVTHTTWCQRVIARHRSPALARTHAALRRAAAAIVGRAGLHTYHAWEEPTP